MTDPRPHCDKSECVLSTMCGGKFIPPCATHSPAAPSTDTLGELKITQDVLYEFCEWFCDHNVDCSETPCNISVSRLHDQLEGIMKQMKDHPEYLEKWNAKRAEQEFPPAGCVMRGKPVVPELRRLL